MVDIAQDSQELIKTRQGVIFNFLNSYNSLKENFLIYSVYLNQMSAINEGKDFNIDALSDAERERLGILMTNLQVFLLDSELLFNAIVKKTGTNDESDLLVKQMQNARKEFVVNRESILVILQGLTNYIADKLAPDLMQSDTYAVSSITGK